MAANRSDDEGKPNGSDDEGKPNGSHDEGKPTMKASRWWATMI